MKVFFPMSLYSKAVVFPDVGVFCTVQIQIHFSGFRSDYSYNWDFLHFLSLESGWILIWILWPGISLSCRQRGQHADTLEVLHACHLGFSGGRCRGAIDSALWDLSHGVFSYTTAVRSDRALKCHNKYKWVCARQPPLLRHERQVYACWPCVLNCYSFWCIASEHLIKKLLVLYVSECYSHALGKKYAEELAIVDGRQ